MKDRFLTLKLLIAAFIIFFSLLSCQQKKIIVSGYAFGNDLISISFKSKRILHYVHKCTSSEPCSIYEQVNLDNYVDGEISIRIDSMGHKLIDTSFFLESKNKEPVILFQNPRETNCKRKIVMLNISKEVKY